MKTLLFKEFVRKIFLILILGISACSNDAGTVTQTSQAPISYEIQSPIQSEETVDNVPQSPALPEQSVSLSPIVTPIADAQATQVTIIPDTIIPVSPTIMTPQESITQATLAATSAIDPQQTTEVSTSVPKDIPTLPIPTITPTSVPFVEIISDTPLTFDPSRSEEGVSVVTESGETSGPNVSNAFVLLGWSENNEIVVRPGVYVPGSDATPHPQTQWAIQPTTGQARIAVEWTEAPSFSPEQEALLQTLNTIPSDFPRIPSPDGQRIAVKDVISSTLSVYNATIGDQAELNLPLDPTDIFKLVAKQIAWSPDGNKLAYVISSSMAAFGVDEEYYLRFPDAHPYLGLYQLQVYDFEQQQLFKYALPSVSYSPSALDWSPDGQYLAFTAPPDLRMPHHVFALQLSDQSVQDLTPNRGEETVLLDIVRWSPDGNRLAYGDKRSGLVNTMEVEIK